VVAEKLHGCLLDRLLRVVGAKPAAKGSRCCVDDAPSKRARAAATETGLLRRSAVVFPSWFFI
jgi:hypothetical protein